MSIAVEIDQLLADWKNKVKEDIEDLSDNPKDKLFKALRQNFDIFAKTQYSGSQTIPRVYLVFHTLISLAISLLTLQDTKARLSVDICDRC
jgi:hypothetical protein